MSETPGLSFAHLGGLGNGGWRGALRIAQRQAPLRGEGSGKLGWGLPAEAGVGPFGVIVCAPGRERGAGMMQGREQGLVQEFGVQKDIHQVVDLGHTFRSVDEIALAARRFILKNPAQIEKTIIPAGEAEGPALRVVWTKKAKQEAELLETLTNLTELGAKERGTGKVTSVLLLARYRHERPDMAAIGRKFPNLSLSFKTIHGSKGLEADHVVILGCNNGKYGFPSEVTDDPILSLVSPEGEPFQHAEERRIMYVAMTRARSTVTLLASEAEPSCFVRELVSETEYGLATSTGSIVGHVPCRECGGRLLPVPARDGRVWYRCEHSLMCCNYMPACSHCGIGMPTVSGTSGTLECSHCGADHHQCPKCSDGWLVEKHGRYGDFFSCVRYPDCTGKASVSEIRFREAARVEGVDRHNDVSGARGAG